MHLREVGFPGRDVDFGRLVERLSGRESGPAGADNFVTNEDSFPRVCGEIARRVPEDGVYLGVGPDQNFTYIAHARPSLAFIIDHRRRNLLLQLLHKALFMLAEDRVGYLALLTARDGRCPAVADAKALVTAFERAPFDRKRLADATAEVADLLRPLDIVRDDEWVELATIHARLAGPGLNARFLALPIYPTLAELIQTPDRDGKVAHMLARDDLYQTVRRAQLDDRVIPLVGDFAGPIALPRLAGWLRERAQEVSLLYISDVEFFLLRAGTFGAYAVNLARLPWAEGAIVVRTSTREIDHPGRVQGDSATTIVRRAAPFLAAATAGRIRTVEDLFAAEPPA